MPIINQTVADGDPRIQADGPYRGIITYEFDDGSEVTRHVMAPNAQARDGEDRRIENIG